MTSDERDQRLSRISTLWTMVFQAHGGPADDAACAQQRLLERYGGAVLRYLLGAVHDPDVAEELFQEFALRFVRGDFRRAVPQRGRLRDYFKTVLIHLVNDYHRSRQRHPQPLVVDHPVADRAENLDSHHQFLQDWREELVDRTWKKLAKVNRVYHDVLLMRIQNPEASSAELAELLTKPLDKQVSAAWVRKTLQRSQAKFATLLIDEVADSLETTDLQSVQVELQALDLLKYCRSALETRAKPC